MNSKRTRRVGAAGSYSISGAPYASTTFYDVCFGMTHLNTSEKKKKEKEKKKRKGTNMNHPSKAGFSGVLSLFSINMPKV
jgi:hypothetical protein